MINDLDETEECLTADTIAQIVTRTSALSRQQFEHVSRCGRCCILLSAAQTDEPDETVPEPFEAEVWATAIKLRKAAALPRASNPRRWSPGLFAWSAGGALLAAACIPGLWLGCRLTRPSIETILAKAYTADRTIKMRIPLAQSAPLKQWSGGEHDLLRRDSELFNAEAEIRSKLKSSPNDPRWCKAEGTAKLLSGNANAAVNILEPLLERDPSSPDLQNLLGAAYFERAQLRNTGDLEAAHELLHRANERLPNDSVVLFNYALVLKQLKRHAHECDVWRRYMQVEPDPGWRIEGQRYWDECRAQRSILRHTKSARVGLGKV
jgi:tetratricopeptide (TPR) repeat protein